MKSRQSGITLIGFLVVLIVIAFFGFMAMKLVPSYLEFLGVKKAMSQIASAGTNGKSLDDLRRDLAFKMNFQYVDDSTIQPSNVTVVRNSGGASTLNVKYDKQVPFIANVDFLLHFDNSVALQGNVGE
jgi:type II secretory pathway pseudopilin PulG